MTRIAIEADTVVNVMGSIFNIGGASYSISNGNLMSDIGSHCRKIKALTANEIGKLIDNLVPEIDFAKGTAKYEPIPQDLDLDFDHPGLDLDFEFDFNS